MTYITCERLISTLDDFVAGDMNEAEHREVERHLERCDSCVNYTASYRRTIELEKSLSKDDLRARLPEEVVRRIASRRRE